MGDVGVDDFYVVLPSNSNPRTHSKNTANKYIVSWETPIHFGNVHDWRVALTEMSYNYCPQSVTSGFGIEYIQYSNFTIDKLVDIHGSFNKYPLISDASYLHLISIPSLQDIEAELREVSQGVPSAELDAGGRLVLRFKYQFALSFNTLAEANRAGFDKMLNTSLPDKDSTLGHYILKSEKRLYKETIKEEEKEDFIIKATKLTIRSDPIGQKKTGHFDKAILWENIGQLLDSIKEVFSKVFEKIEIDSTNGRIKLELHDNISQVCFLNGLNFVLGFSRTKITNKVEIADFPPQLNRGLTHMYVYASICAPIQVGHTRVPLLKSIWMDVTKSYTHDEVRNVNIRHPMYLPINSASMNSIEINIRTDSGALVPFTEGSVTSITLHFKRV